MAGALSFAYRAGLEAAGFEDIQITPTDRIGDGLRSAIDGGDDERPVTV
jgi:hypothetical protein